MPIQIGENAYKCSICGKIYEPGNGSIKHGGSPALRARECEKSHDVIYLPITKIDLGKLIQFIFTRDESLITEELYKTMLRYYNTKGE